MVINHTPEFLHYPILVFFESMSAWDVFFNSENS
jgi:hypothetical protein